MQRPSADSWSRRRSRTPLSFSSPPRQALSPVRTWSSIAAGSEPARGTRTAASPQCWREMTFFFQSSSPRYSMPGRGYVLTDATPDECTKRVKPLPWLSGQTTRTSWRVERLRATPSVIAPRVAAEATAATAQAMSLRAVSLVCAVGRRSSGPKAGKTSSF
jgi:hypothetical protein